MFKNTIKQFLYVTLQEKTNAINILGKYAYCAGGSIARNSGAVNKKLTIQGECVKAIPHNSKCRYGERGTAAAKPKAQIILDAAKVSAASGGNSEPKQGQRSQSARGFCPRSTMRVPQPDIIEHFGNADAVPQLPERCLSRKAGIVRCCLMFFMGGISICSILPLLPSTPKSALNFFSIRNHGVWHCFVPLQPAYT